MSWVFCVRLIRHLFVGYCSTLRNPRPGVVSECPRNPGNRAHFQVRHLCLARFQKKKEKKLSRKGGHLRSGLSGGVAVQAQLAQDRSTFCMSWINCIVFRHPPIANASVGVWAVWALLLEARRCFAIQSGRVHAYRPLLRSLARSLRARSWTPPAPPPPAIRRAQPNVQYIYCVCMVILYI
jgi:hypothetical protein